MYWRFSSSTNNTNFNFL